MDDIKALRAEVARREKAARQKIQRQHRKGVRLAGSEFDIRRDPAKTGRYTRKQLNAYLGELNAFTSRSTQFVAGVEGAPLSRDAWNRYKKAEAAYIDKVGARYSVVGGTPLPVGDQTVKEFEKKFRPKKSIGKGGFPRPLENIEARDPSNIMSQKALDKLTRSLENKSRPKYVPKTLKKQRYQMLEAVKEFGDVDLLEKAYKLTNNQLDILWNYTDAPRDLFAGYNQYKLFAAGKADDTSDAIYADSAEETKVWLDWAAKLPKR